MSFHDKQVKIQIEIAELQADLQVHLTLCFGTLAILVALTIGFFQMYVSLDGEQSLLRTLLIGLIPSLVVISLVTVVFFTKKALVVSEEIRKLSRRYLWEHAI